VVNPSDELADGGAVAVTDGAARVPVRLRLYRLAVGLSTVPISVPMPQVAAGESGSKPVGTLG